MGAPPERLVTVPVITPGVGVRAKLTPTVVCAAVTVAGTVWELKPGADAVRVWLRGESWDTLEEPGASVVFVLGRPLSMTVAAATGAPPVALLTVPLTVPG